MFAHVYRTMPPYLERQREGLRAFLKEQGKGEAVHG